METALDGLRTSIVKAHGKDAILSGDSFSRNERYAITSPSMNTLLGGGIPAGKIIEIYGPESVGKSTIAEAWCADLQAQNKAIAYIDAENAFDPQYAKDAFNLDVFDSNLAIFSQPSSGEEALEIVDKVIQSGLVSLVVVDSVAALTPQAELEGEMGDQQMGLQARLIGKALRKIKSACNTKGVTVVFINQLRMKIGFVMGNPETTPGGLALKFYASIRMDVRKVEPLKRGEEIYGHKMRIKTVKNKTFFPFRKIETNLIYGKGFDYTSEYIDYAIAQNLISKSGSWYIINEERFQGMENLKKGIEGSPFFDDLKKQVDTTIGKSLVLTATGKESETIKEKKKRVPKVPKAEEEFEIVEAEFEAIEKGEMNDTDT